MNKTDVIGTIILMILVFSPILWLAYYLKIQENEQDRTEIDKGEVTDKTIKTNLGPNNYIITLNNNSEYDITEHEYEGVSVGDKVIIYESGRCEVQ